MSFKDKSVEEIKIILDRMKVARFRRRNFELDLELAIEVTAELVTATNQALFQLRKDKAPNEVYKTYYDRAIKAKTSLGNFRRIRQEYNTARNGSEVSNWFERVRRNIMGTT